MKKIAVIDYSIGNLFSVLQACKEVGLSPYLATEPKDLEDADGVILPGVGAFAKGMESLKAKGLDVAIKSYIDSGKPFMGICLGMQLLLDKSDEFIEYEGLGVIPGTVRKLSAQIELPVPKICWDEIYPRESDWSKTPLEGIGPGEDFYFIHSYYCELKEKEHELSFSKHGDLEYTSSISKGNVFACQYHPEKSANSGLKMYKNWKKFYLKCEE